MFKRIFLLISFCVLVGNLYSQGEIDDQRKIFFRNETSFGGYLSSTGYGIGYQHAKRLDGYKKNLIEIDLVTINHPKEKKTQNPYIDQNQKRFVFGKLNSLMSLRVGIGRQKELYSKFDKGGISVRRYFTFGSSLGIVKPMYYEVLYPTGTPNEYYVVTEKFNSTIHNVTDIYSRSSFWIGIDELKFIPGAYFKYGFTFEFGEYDEFLRAIDLGIILDAYIKETPIMAIEENNQIYLSLFLSYRI
ncbi:MAG: hypothetical protein A2265_01255, partial [Bacteroidetes bacterium RIFOXYA12_FULL_33_9]